MAYIPVEYPAVASYQVVNALLQAADELRITVHPGIIISSDAYYGGNEEVLRRFGEANVLSIEMEASLMFTLAGIKGTRAGAICTIDGNIFKGTGKGEFEPGENSGELAEKVQNSIEDEIRIAIRAVQILDKD
jgi:uridine phosphorylase